MMKTYSNMWNVAIWVERTRTQSHASTVILTILTLNPLRNSFFINHATLLQCIQIRIPSKFCPRNVRNTKVHFPVILPFLPFNSLTRSPRQLQKVIHQYWLNKAMKMIFFSAVMPYRLTDTNVLEKYTVYIFRADYEDSMSLWNIVTYLQVYILPQPRRALVIFTAVRISNLTQQSRSVGVWCIHTMDKPSEL